MPSLEQRVEALERQMADLQAMLESLLDCMRQQRADMPPAQGTDATEARHA